MLGLIRSCCLQSVRLYGKAFGTILLAVRSFRSQMDCSVSKPSEKEAILARKLLKLEACVRLVKFEVYDEINNTVSYYIGSKPTFNSNTSLTGRATQTFVVADLDMEHIVFLNDTWRIDLPDMMKEGMIYHTLHKANVSNIPSFI